MRTSLLFAFSALSALGLASSPGCGGHDTSSSSSGSGGAAAGGIGTAKDTWLTDSGEVTGIPRPTLTVSAVFRSPGDRWNEIDGTYNPATGTFDIKDIPEGPYYLRVGKNEYYATTVRSGIDLGRVNVGRPDAQKITTSPTNLSLDLTNVTAWQAGDRMELYALGAAAWDDLARMTPTPPAAGATMLTGFTADLSTLAFPGLIDGGKGDKATLTHLTARMAGSVLYWSIGQALSLPSLTLTDGQAAMSAGAFQDVSQAQIMIDWKRSAFAALVADAGQGAMVDAYRVSAWIEPGGKDRLSFGPKANLLDYSDSAPGDVALNLAYGSPFPAAFGVIASVDVLYHLAENVPGPDNQLTAELGVTAPIDMLFQGPVVPQIGPPTGVTIGGMPATTDLMGVSDRPEIAWKAPAMGTPKSYEVRIWSFPKKLVASLSTTDTALSVPSGILQSGQSYAITVAASTVNLDLKAPYRVPPTGASASTLTHLFTP